MNIVFAGTPEFAAAALRSLHEAGFRIPLVFTQPDRPAGRGMQLQPSPVKRFAIEHGMRVGQPLSLRLDGKHPELARQAHALLQASEPDVMVVAAYGLILPRSVLEIPRLGCINIHASLLPRWRGAAPIHRAIEAGDTQTGVTIMQMDEGLDTGAMLASRSLPIARDETTGSLHDKLAALGAEMIVAALRDIGQARPMPQPAEGVTYAAKISKDEAALDFSRPAQELERCIRAFNPFPGATALVNGTVLKLWRAVPDDAGGQPGRVLAADEAGVLVACGTGSLRICELQKPGGKRLPAGEFLKGFPLTGAYFS
ncbi:MAG TPA: methionyl-tRNA formyltransferase [Noviherbaspirillum sp.]